MSETYHEEPTRAIRVALSRARQENWDRTEDALLEALSATRRRQMAKRKEATA